jgi:hypothetical protein
MARCSFFVSAPAVRFLKTLGLVGLIPAPQRQAIAADISGAIASLAGRDFDHLQCCARALQDERWLLISSGISTIADVAFARVTILEQWLRARLEVLRPGSPITEILAERICRAVDEFVCDNSTLPTGQVIRLPAKPETLTIVDGASRAAA